MSCGNYANISKFGVAAGQSPQNDPVTYCAVSGLLSGFNHTLGSGSSLLGPNSSQCQLFMAQRCAQGPEGWDGICEYLSNDEQKFFPNTVSACNGPNGSCMGSGLGNAMTSGQILIRNTAAEKYLVAMSGNCVRAYEPFDPTVAASPLISRWTPSGNSCAGAGNCNASNVCIPIYDVDVNSVDNDLVMNKILKQPWIALDILVNIYNNRANTGRLGELRNTKLGKYFATDDFKSIASSGIKL